MLNSEDHFFYDMAVRIPGEI